LPRISYRKPLDQPLGNSRIFDWIIGSLGGGRFRSFRFVSAFAKEGPMLRLIPYLKRFRVDGGFAEAVIGVDHQGTSLQALTLALAELDRVFIWHHPNPFTTFHPKLYIFHGEDLGQIYIGSNNMTVGGLETNCEAGVQLSYDLPGEAVEWAGAIELWSELVAHSNSVRLDLSVLARLVEEDRLLDESIIVSWLGPRGARTVTARTARPLFPYCSTVPPTARPKPQAAVPRRTAKRTAAQATAAVAATAAPGIPRALVIQIVPHHNGEVFLSKRAINQYPLFFGFPFQGQTVPKTVGNQAYPQRTPDPVTDWKVYDRQGRVLRSLEDFRLNTVYYELKGEIRITIPPDVARQIPHRSILVVTRGTPDSGLDYQCEVFPPNSVQYQSLRQVCTETMPSGGSGTPRKFGWL
jgi:hypothetical protein